MTFKFLDFLPEKDKVIFIRIKHDDNINKQLEQLGFSCTVNDIWQFNAIKFKLIRDFGTRDATDLIVVSVEKSKALIAILKKKGIYLSDHEAINAAAYNQLMYEIKGDNKTQFILLAVGDFELEKRDIHKITSILFPRNITDIDYNTLSLKLDKQILKKFDSFADSFEGAVVCRCEPCSKINNIQRIDDVRVPLIKLFLELVDLFSTKAKIDDDRVVVIISDWDDVLTHQGYIRCNCKVCNEYANDFIEYDDIELDNIYQDIVKLAFVKWNEARVIGDIPLKDKFDLFFEKASNKYDFAREKDRTDFIYRIVARLIKKNPGLEESVSLTNRMLVFDDIVLYDASHDELSDFKIYKQKVRDIFILLKGESGGDD